MAKLLLVEDESGLALTIGDRLVWEGHEVDHAADGQTGLEMAMTGGYQLVILDVMLPRKSGLDVCRALRQNGMRTAVLMLTARAQVIDRVVGLEIGADDYLTKPVGREDLLAAVRTRLARNGVQHVLRLRQGQPAS